VKLHKAKCPRVKKKELGKIKLLKQVYNESTAKTITLLRA
jgi:hypothetical protein